MKTNLTWVLFLCTVIVQSCQKESIENSSRTSEIKVKSITLKISKPAGTFWMSESEPIVLSVDVQDDNGKVYQNYNGKVTYFANGKELSGSQYNFEIEGEIEFKAKINDVESSVSSKYLVKNPNKELDKIVLTNAFYSKFAVNHTLIGSKPELSVKGYDKNNAEIPIKKGIKATIGNETISLDNFSFTKAGTNKITLNAYGKQVETTFEVRKERTFEVVRIPVVFHFCKPSPYSHPATKQTDAEFIELAIEQLKNGKKIAQLNAMFRNKFVSNELDPNASDTFIEFYLADRDPSGNLLKEVGVNRLNFMRPYVALTENYLYNASQAQFDLTLSNELAKWNTNSYFNIVVENFGNWGYAGIAKMSMMDNNRKNLIPQEYNNLSIINLNSEKLAWSNTNTRYFNDHVRINGAANILTDSPSVGGVMYKNSVLSHEIGHALGLPHTFGFQENCQDQNHSDGLFDTPRQVSANYDTSCDGIKFAQRNLMNYMSTDSRGSFTYDQVTVMRARIEASFNIPTPRNKGKNSMRFVGQSKESDFVIID